MTPQQKQEFVIAIEPLAIAFKTELSEARLHVYWMALHDVGLEAFQYACAEALRIEKFFPVPATLREYAETFWRWEHRFPALPDPASIERQRQLDRADALRTIETHERILTAWRTIPHGQ
jgi:hypothetical protein